MAPRTIVSIYEVDEWATTGPWAGRGSLLCSRSVVVHPPLSEQLAKGEGPDRLRVGIFPAGQDPDEGGFPEIIDVWGKPRMLWSEGDSSIVVLDLRDPSEAPPDAVVEGGAEDDADAHCRALAAHVKGISQPREISQENGVPPEQPHIDDAVPVAMEVMSMRTAHVIWCRFIPGLCKHRR